MSTKGTEIAAAPAARSRSRGRSMEARNQRFAYLMITPSLLVVALVALYPMANTVLTSFTNSNFGQAQAQFVGLDNYNTLLHDRTWWRSVWLTIRFTVITVAFEFVLGLIIALVVNSNFKARGAMRAAMLIPWALITVISAAMWKLMYNQIYGVFNDFFVYRLHLASKNIDFLGASTALYSTAAIDIWKTTPFIALLLLAGLQVISSDLYEAASVDGAGKVRTFFSITLPLLMPAVMVAVIFRALDALRVFDLFYVLYGNRVDTTTMSIYVQENIVSFGKVGYGSAVSMGVLALLGVFVALYVVMNRRVASQ